VKRETETWVRLSSATEDRNTRRLVWEQLKRLSPPAKWPLSSVTQRKGDPIPATKKESLNNMASF